MRRRLLRWLEYAILAALVTVGWYAALRPFAHIVIRRIGG